jgi:uncharacterized protein YciI
VSTFAVSRKAGPAWTPGGIYDQPAVSEHAAFMNGLATEGFILLGGPLGGSEDGHIRVLLIVDAASEAEVTRRLADDPWTATRQITTVSIEPWNIFVGDDRWSGR